jgi:formylglycine-generating enzyme required for sulfatase activity
MPHERGGRLHHDPAASRWQVSDGYERHPVYWVTWIGAAAFAAWEGARLPSRAEITRLTMTSTRPVQHAGYRFPDVAPVTEPGLGDEDIHHLAGNVQVWCSDGPDAAVLLGGPAARWLHGAAWNTPGTPEEIHRARARHMTGSSRGVGIRLVRDGTQHPASPGELAGLLDAWISSLADRSGTLAGMDSRLIRALSGSQADAGLSAHVAASTGEPGHG